MEAWTHEENWGHRSSSSWCSSNLYLYREGTCLRWKDPLARSCKRSRSWSGACIAPESCDCASGTAPPKRPALVPGHLHGQNKTKSASLTKFQQYYLLLSQIIASVRIYLRSQEAGRRPYKPLETDPLWFAVEYLEDYTGIGSMAHESRGGVLVI